MSRILAALAVSAGLILICAGAERAPLEAAFGGAIISTYPDGRTAELWLQRDGAYSARGRRGDPSSGHWQIKGDQLCLKQSRPFHAPFSFCTPMPDGGAGASWSAKAVTGEPIRVTLVKGRGGKSGGTRSAAAPNN